MRQNLLSIKDLNQEKLSLLIDKTIYFKQNKPEKLLEGKKIALVFAENSLRTKISFELAVQMLGGIANYVQLPNFLREFDNTEREDYVDILKCVDSWSDALVIRDYSQKYFNTLLKISKHPIIDGFCCKDHPTQTITDLATIKYVLGDLKNVKVCFVGPSDGSAIMESFAYGAVIMGMETVFLLPYDEYLPKNSDFFKTISNLQKIYHGKFSFTSDKVSALKNSDILYVDEWWENSPNFLEKNVGNLQINDSFLKSVSKNIKIMHCLPAHHGREITKKVLFSRQSVVFKQAEFRLYSAIASLLYIFEIL
ncbi:MAG: hypothetical protein NTW11_01930 [Candidatus Staskawiczbacteria bacterium]|nr:hypothetical protein [Candidatus Staskawiczbacteria bacterium]